MPHICNHGATDHLREKSYTVSTTADVRYHAHFQYEPDMVPQGTATDGTATDHLVGTLTLLYTQNVMAPCH
jgi:hypothetical protein